MLYLAQLHIDHSASWGGVYQKDVVLPNRIHSIRALFCNAQLDPTTFLIPTIIKHPIGVAYEPQIGSLSVSINARDLLVPNMPLLAQNRLETSWQRNICRLEQPYKVQNGSMLRLILEERIVCPFYNQRLALYSDDNRKALLTAAGLSDTLDLTNSYTVNLYVDYD